MTLLMGVVLILGVLLWRANSSWEWDIPQKWQAKIGAWKEGLSSPTHVLNYDWSLEPENTEWEKNLWQLKRAYPRLRKEFMAPIRAEVSVYPNFPPDQNKIYIACLQRRFPEVRLTVNPQGSETRGQVRCFGDSGNGDEGKDYRV